MSWLLLTLVTAPLAALATGTWFAYHSLVDKEDEDRRNLGLRSVAEDEDQSHMSSLVLFDNARLHSRTEARIRVARGDDEYSRSFFLLRAWGKSTHESMNALGALYGGTEALKLLAMGCVFGPALLGLGGWLLYLHYFWCCAAALLGGLCILAAAWMEAGDWWHEAREMAPAAWILFWVALHLASGWAAFLVSLDYVSLSAVIRQIFDIF